MRTLSEIEAAHKLRVKHIITLG